MERNERRKRGRLMEEERQVQGERWMEGKTV